MTIHWNLPTDADPPVDINIYHEAPDGTVTGPITVTATDLSDELGGLAPDAVRARLVEYLRANADPTDPLWREVVYDMLELDYQQGVP